MEEAWNENQGQVHGSSLRNLYAVGEFVQACGGQATMLDRLNSTRGVTLTAAEIVRTTERSEPPGTRLPAHHLPESLGRFFKRISFDHRPHGSQLGKMQCLLGSPLVFPQTIISDFQP
jgi:hypothetical protein